MTWLVWRQHRKQLLFGVIGLAAIAGFVVPTGVMMHNRFSALKLPGCLPALMAKTTIAEGGECFGAAESFFNDYQMVILAALVLMILPMLVGMFWGAPLVAREVEHGTHRLVWTQGVSRARWAIVKFGWIAAGVVVLTAIYTAMYTWWITPVIDTSRQAFGYIFFDAHGFVVFGYVVFGLALGIFAGAIHQKMLPSMATTFVGFMGMRLFVMLVARPRFMAVQHRRALSKLHQPRGRQGGPHGDPQRVPRRLAPRRPALRGGREPAVHRHHDDLQAGREELHRHYGLPLGRGFPPREPLLDLPVDRDGDLRGTRDRAARSRGLLGSQADRLADVAHNHKQSGRSSMLDRLGLPSSTSGSRKAECGVQYGASVPTRSESYVRNATTSSIFISGNAYQWCADGSSGGTIASASKSNPLPA